MSSRCLGSLALLIVAVFLAAGCGDPPQPEPEPPAEFGGLAHFLCYESTALGSGAYPTVEVQDQFYRGPVPFNLLPGGERFCNPVVKTHGDSSSVIPNRDHHLVAIQGGSAEPLAEGAVTVFNQFFPEGQELTVERTQGQYLMVPARKTGIDPEPQGWEGHGEPADLNHFKCYPVKENQSPDAVVDLTDQVTTYKDVPMMDAELLCNPTSKRHGSDRYPIREIEDEKDHLVCYNIERPVAVSFRARHQLRPGGDSFTARGLEWLCVPSRKEPGKGWWSAVADSEGS